MGPAVAWLTASPSLTTMNLCQHCLDWWFDGADDDAGTEPAAWGWIKKTN